ncbi:MAG TPA: hypothetical protein PL064_13915, partial [Thermogutta sp.]|nr:hypothetical protein [Thermogutta sp.]
ITGVAPSAGVYNHTNWMFSEDQTPGGTINGDYIGAVVAHENGHAFGLYHQGDWTGGTNVNEYSNGDAFPGCCYWDATGVLLAGKAHLVRTSIAIIMREMG